MNAARSFGWQSLAGAGLVLFVAGTVGWRVAHLRPAAACDPQVTDAAGTGAPSLSAAVPRANADAGLAGDAAAPAPAPADGEPTPGVAPAFAETSPGPFPPSLPRASLPRVQPETGDAEPEIASDVPRIEPVSARAWRDRYRAVAAAAPDDYLATAGAVLASRASLAEKVAAMRAAEDAAPAALDALYAMALDPARTGDASIRDVAVVRLTRRAARDPVAASRLFESVLADASAPDNLRSGAAAAVFAAASEEQAERMLRDVNGLRDAPWPAIVRGLSANPSPRVRERAAEVSRGLWWVPGLGGAAAVTTDVDATE